MTTETIATAAATVEECVNLGRELVEIRDKLVSRLRGLQEASFSWDNIQGPYAMKRAVVSEADHIADDLEGESGSVFEFERLADDLDELLAMARITDDGLRAAAERYHSDPDYRASMPCSECGKTGGCEHFPNGGDDAA